MIEAAAFRKVLGHHPTGVCVITSIDPNGTPTGNGIPIGMSVGSFTSVSLDPPLVAFFPDRRSATWQRVHEQVTFASTCQVTIRKTSHKGSPNHLSTSSLASHIGHPTSGCRSSTASSRGSTADFTPSRRPAIIISSSKMLSRWLRTKPRGRCSFIRAATAN